MNKYEKINYDELEELSIVGGMDANAITTADSDVVVASIAYTTYELTQLTVALSAVSIAYSKLYSCTKNKVTCKRRK
ncbi:hypothetical protein C671_0365 [[Clostridium] bifermentans ATCC 19299]|uniref:hypothetical protein n=1 Tax=Paraclostridium bifermentans TaxID=1490 RepID=UPI00038CB5B4|nr:hypothetical protein [Paraclostridium bifermentans]EQK48653.1 hypothetical protein C671_0365 [[Clostridium] bifermentans ATCC 19299] [Paraclostridium bifermentans ATCC 19299]MCR1876773.1 hypothetical protein [Paraclostridium bifermentans]